ncbi:MAG: hypothetical protein ACRD7E_29825, partial [Bryobacteraceae bacterium]
QYAITTQMTSFKTDVSQVTLLADQNRAIRIELAIGETVQTVTAVSETVNPDFSTPTLSQVIEEKRIVELPLDGRNAAQLTLLVGGAVDAPSNGIDQGNTKTFPGAQTNIPGSTAGTDARRRFQQFSSNQMMSNSANSSYNGLGIGVGEACGIGERSGVPSQHYTAGQLHVFKESGHDGTGSGLEHGRSVCAGTCAV